MRRTGKLDEVTLKKIYLFSLIFSYPTEDVLEKIREMSEELDLDLKPILDAERDEIETEYTNLFVNSYPTLPCPPYESYYREGRLFGDSADEVMKLYRKRGLDFNHTEAPDHVSVQLEFLALTGDSEFFERMRGWIFDFTARVKKQSSIYSIFAEELEKLLKN